MTERHRYHSFADLSIQEELILSPLVLKTAAKLQALPLSQIKEAGIWRDRRSYFLNIAYPSLQAMNEAEVAEVTATNKDSRGRTAALYVHVPFCTTECYYCHYYKQFDRPETDVDDYLNTVDQELNLQEARFGGLATASIYIGGGTPSYLTPDQINRLFTSIKRYTKVPPDIEISFEMHPESVTTERLAVLKNHGVNRISLGVESFDNTILAEENRRHTAQDAVDAFGKIQEAGFDNINIDLIYGLRGQTLTIWEENLAQIAELQPASATMYYLRLKHGTPEFKLWQQNPTPFPTDYELLLVHAMNFEKMEGELGYIQNPVDWFIKNPSYFHHYQDHNWRKTDETHLLGIGPSAYSYVDGWQYYNINDTRRWKAKVTSNELPIWKGEYLEGEEKMRRTVMLGIKMGIDRLTFARTYGVDVVAAFPETWERLVNLGLVEVKPDSIDLTYTGKLFADEVGQQFYSDEMKRRMVAVDPTLVSTTWPQFNP